MPLFEPDVVYLAADGFVDELCYELRSHGDELLAVRERLVLVKGPVREPAWAQNVWQSPRWVPADSISQAAGHLRDIQRNWCAHPVDSHRRAALITARLPHVSARPLVYGEPAPDAPLGSWTLWEHDLLLVSAECSSPFPDGEAAFVENRVDPPSRAYLKLWETFTRLGIAPRAGELCVDLGACPGGWTWVLAQHGARVFSVDKAPLADHVAANPLVFACQGSGFALDPRDAGNVDWLCSDMICYPERLWKLVVRWLEHETPCNIVCTIKFQGTTDHATAALFAAIPGSRLMHLSVNRHELTWVRMAPKK